MITLIENALTKKKHTLNFIDHNGKVLGYNPKTKDIKFTVRDSNGKVLVDETTVSLEKFLIGNRSHFGKDFSYTIASEYDDSISSLDIDLIRDDVFSSSSETMFLHIEGIGGEYYIEDIALSKDDKEKLFLKNSIEMALKKVDKISKSTITTTYLKPKSWETMTVLEKLDNLHKRLSKLEKTCI